MRHINPNAFDARTVYLDKDLQLHIEIGMSTATYDNKIARDEGGKPRPIKEIDEINASFDGMAEALLHLIIADIENLPTVKKWNTQCSSRVKVIAFNLVADKEQVKEE